MSKRENLVSAYADDLRSKCGTEPDLELLEKITNALGPSIYNADASLVAGSDVEERETIRKNFLIGKLGLPDGPDLMQGIETVIDTYGSSERRKHRAVVYYLLVKHFGKEALYA